MQNLSPQLPNVIDTLDQKITLMQSEISLLKSKNLVISDSLKTLNETLKAADLKTSFYSDQLSFQLFWFSIFLALIGFFSWKWIIDPINNSVYRLGTKEFPALKSFIKNKLRIEKENQRKFNLIINEKLNEARADNYRSIALFFVNIGNPSYSFFYSLKLIYHNNRTLKEPEDKKTLSILKNLLKYSHQKDFNIEIINSYPQEIKLKLDFFISHSNVEFSSIAVDIKKRILELSKIPTSAVEASPEDFEEATESGYSSSLKADGE